MAVNFSSFKSSNELSDSMEGIPRHQSIWLSLQLLEHNQRAQKNESSLAMEVDEKNGLSADSIATVDVDNLGSNISLLRLKLRLGLR